MNASHESPPERSSLLSAPAGSAAGCKTAWGVPVDSPADVRSSPPIHAEVLIVGGGITGLTAALHLLHAGKRVTVIEQGAAGSGTTGRSSAHLTTLPDSELTFTERMFSAAENAKVVRAMAGAIDEIERWCSTYDIACGFSRVPGYYFAEDEEGARALEQEATAGKRAGLNPIPDTAPIGYPVRAAFRLENQGIFDPALYADGLARACVREGGVFLPETRLLDFHDGEPCRVETTRGEFSADAVILATHTPLGRSLLHGELKPYRSYLIAVELNGDFPNALFWDTAEPYHYIRRIDTGPPLLLIGGADHRTGQGDGKRDPYSELESWTRERFDAGNVVARWSAQFYAPIDGYPYVGKPLTGKNLYVATGYNGDGLTLGTASARILADLLLERENELADLFSPTRVNLRAAAEATKLNVQAAARCLIGRSGDVSPAAGEGVVHQVGTGVEAHYHAPDGSVHRFSAVCPHMKCIVQWNRVEKTWDCPCHGGRFSPFGERIEGPPRANLSPCQSRMPEHIPTT